MRNRNDRRLAPRLVLASAMTLTGLAVTSVARTRNAPHALAYSGVLLAATGTVGIAVLRPRRR